MKSLQWRKYFSNAHKNHLECFLKHRFGELLQTLLGDQVWPFALLSEALKVVLTARLEPYLGPDSGNLGSRKAPTWAGLSERRPAAPVGFELFWYQTTF